MKAIEDSKNHILIAEKVCGWSFRSNVWTSINGIESYLEHPFLDARQREGSIEAARLKGWYICSMANRIHGDGTLYSSFVEKEDGERWLMGNFPSKAFAEFSALLWVAQQIN